MRAIVEKVTELKAQDKIELDTEAEALFARKPMVVGGPAIDEDAGEMDAEEDQGTLEVTVDELDKTLDLQGKCKELEIFCKKNGFYSHTDKVRGDKLKFSAQDYQGPKWNFQYSDKFTDIMFRDFYDTTVDNNTVEKYGNLVKKVCVSFRVSTTFPMVATAPISIVLQSARAFSFRVQLVRVAFFWKELTTAAPLTSRVHLVSDRVSTLKLLCSPMFPSQFVRLQSSKRTVEIFLRYSVAFLVFPAHVFIDKP
jgi:hypothetical protein